MLICRGLGTVSKTGQGSNASGPADHCFLEQSSRHTVLSSSLQTTLLSPPERHSYIRPGMSIALYQVSLLISIAQMVRHDEEKMSLTEITSLKAPQVFPTRHASLTIADAGAGVV